MADVSSNGWLHKPITLTEAWNADAYVNVYVTATMLDMSDLGEDGDCYTESGWVDTRWNQFELCESRNDVSPEYQTRRRDYPDGDVECMRRDILAILEDVGCTRDSGDGTFYSDDEVSDNRGRVFTYAAHVSARYYLPPHGVVEASVIVA